MKPLLLVAAIVFVAASLPAPARAQSPPTLRGDVAGTIGWLNGNKKDVQTDSYNDWYNSGFYAGAQGGWYWTEHHKTEVEAGLTNSIDFRTYASTTVNGVQSYRSSVYTLTLRRLAIGQHYQFLHNAWVHPHVGAGVDLTWERASERVDPIIGYDPITHNSTQLTPAETRGPETTLRVRPYVETGFKAYMSPRAFFRTDLRMLVRGGIDEVLLRCGFGVDF